MCFFQILHSVMNSSILYNAISLDNSTIFEWILSPCRHDMIKEQGAQSEDTVSSVCAPCSFLLHMVRSTIPTLLQVRPENVYVMYTCRRNTWRSPGFVVYHCMMKPVRCSQPSRDASCFVHLPVFVYWTISRSCTLDDWDRYLLQWPPRSLNFTEVPRSATSWSFVLSWTAGQSTLVLPIYNP